MKSTAAALAIAGAVAACGTVPVGAPAPSMSSSPMMSSPMSSAPMMAPTKAKAKAPMMSSSPMMSSPMASSPMMGTPECTTMDLSVSLTGMNGTAGSIYYNIKFTNTSMTPCFMEGYPGVIAAGMNGDVGSAAVRQMATPEKINLNAGGSATAQLQYKEAATTEMGCNITQASELKIIAPDMGTSQTVPFDNQVCASGMVSVLSIWPVV